MRKILLFLCLIQLSCSSVEERQNSLIQKGFMKIDEGQYDRAVSFFDDAIALEASNALAWNGKGIALYKDGQAYEAIHAFDKAIQLKPDFTRAYYNRSNAFYQVGEYYRTLDDLEPVIANYQDSAFVFLAKGLAEVGLETYQAAKQSFEKAFSIDSLNAEILTNLASVYYFQDSLLLAEKWVNNALKLNAEEANAWNLLSLIQSDLKAYESALESINKAISLKKFQPYFLNNRGYIYSMLERYDLAYEDLRQSLSIDERNPYVYRNLGILAYKKGQLEEANRQLKIALKRKSDLALTHYYLGEVARAAGKKVEACDYYQVSSKAGEPEGEKAIVEFCF